MENKRSLIKKIEFCIGLIMLVLISFYYIYKTIKYSGGFYILSIKNINYSTILILLPIIISSILLFYDKKNIFYKILISLSAVLLISTIIICTIIAYNKFKLLEYIILGILMIISIILIILSFLNKILLGDKKYVK